MIVKVQLPIISTVKKPLAIVYNKDRSYNVLMEITEDLLLSMNGKLKEFFFAEYDKENNNTVLDRVAPWQDW